MILNNITLSGGMTFVAEAAPEPGANIVTDGLVTFFDAGNSSSYSGTGSTWFDISGNDNDGLIINAPTFTSNGASSYFTFAYDYETNPPANTVQCVEFLRPMENSYSICCFFNTTQTGNADPSGFWFDNPALVDNTNPIGRPDMGVAIGNGQIVYGLGQDPYDSSIPGGAPNQYNDGTWHYVICTRDVSESSGVFTIYVDDIQKNTATGFGANPLTLANMCIAAQQTTHTKPYVGSVAVVMIYNRVLTSEERTQNFNALKGRYGL